MKLRALRGKNEYGLRFFLFFFCLSTLPAQANDPIWRQALGGAVIGQPVAQVGSVVAATDGGNLKSFSSRGTLLWDYYARGRLAPFVSRSREGTSYICRANGRLIAINRAGRELWSLFVGGPIVFPVLVGWDGRLFIFTERRITCVTAAGYTLWSRPLGETPAEKIAAAPALDASGGFFFTQANGELLSFDPFGTAWSYRPEISSMMPNATHIATHIAAHTATAAVTVEEIIETDETGTREKIETDAAERTVKLPAVLLLHGDGRVELVYTALKYGASVGGKLSLPAPPFAAVGRNDEAAVLLRDGTVVLVAPERNAVLWTAKSHVQERELASAATDSSTDSSIDAAKLIFDERGIYVTTKTGATGFSHDGRRLWTTTLSGAVAVPAFGDDGVLYSGGEDWVLNAYRLEDRVKARQRLLYGEEAEGVYGTATLSATARMDSRLSEVEILRRFTMIRSGVAFGSIGASEKEYASWLMEISGSFPANPNFSANLPPIHFHHRAEAARLLAFIGSRETIPFLASVFRRDSDPLVKAAAAEAIGRIGVDPDGHALAAFEDALVPPGLLTDERALSAVASAVGALCRFSGPPLGDSGVKILTRIASQTAFPTASARAQRELSSLLRIGN